MTLILGLNAFHADSSAALIRDGNIIAAVEEERFKRVKHYAGFPVKSITWCLEEAGISLGEIDHLAINTLPSANRFRRYAYTILNLPSPLFLLDKIKNKRERTNIKKLIEKYFGKEAFKGELHFIEHHLSHMASAFYPSDFKDAAVVSIDGFGDFASCAVGQGNDTDLIAYQRIFFPHSLGVFYTSITQFLGFPNYGDEYKVMGLAPYGEPCFLEEMKDIVKLNHDGTFKLNLKYFRHSNQRLAHQWSHGAPFVDRHYSEKLCNLLGSPRKKEEELTDQHKNIAASAQRMYEIAFFNFLNAAYLKVKEDKVCLAGGCAANSVANGKITRFTNFKEVFVQAAAGDAGGALGSALMVWHKLYNQRSKPMNSASLGCSNKLDDIDKILLNSSARLKDKNIKLISYSLGDNQLKDENEFLQFIVDEILEGSVIGWFQGRMEWGPRALGNRSILCDPRRIDMKDILNKKIKFRESFRPFAPSVLQEHVKDWFILESELDVNVPFMMKVYPLKTLKRKLVPAVCHVDGTARLQTVNEKNNGIYYRLIQKFYESTNVPMLVNTSFNENEPIVRTLEEAYDCFIRTKMDLLVVDNMIIKKSL
ncbi:carbamoyltransferase [bacterium]|nr:carbamoyltransferase [bacterium]|tara:strand:+ start:410 stop:2191 length:1782 start_codon:yes stop_codon:yes gene_type:complete